MKPLLESFPSNYKPLKHQTPVLRQIDDAIKSGKKFILLQAPTGSGKSMFAASAANATDEAPKKFVDLIDETKLFAKDEFGRFIYEEEANATPSFGMFALTVTKQLQDQYSKLFSENNTFKGRTNYQCAVDDECNAELAPCIMAPKILKKCINEKTCPYYNSRDKILKRKFSTLNYSAFLCLPPHVKRRQIIVCDEASELEDEIVKHFSITINYHDLFKYYDIKYKKLLTDDRNKAYFWLSDLLQDVKEKVDSHSKIIYKKYNGQITQKDINLMFRFKKLVSLYEKISVILHNWYESEYIVEKDPSTVTFSPLYVNQLADNIFKHADHVILMSATIINHKVFAKTLGIKDYKFIEVDSVFDSNKSPIYCTGQYKLNYANIEKNLPKVAKQAIDLCEEYKGKNGIIHTHNFKVTEAIQRLSKGNDRFLFRGDGMTNELILEEHFGRDDGTVLVSPSLSYGTDLAGKHGEFQIIMKLPYLPLGSKRIKTLAEKDRDWYVMKMLINLIQMSGRCTRSIDDKADTFILDGQAFDVLKQNWNNLPKFFKERLK